MLINMPYKAIFLNYHLSSTDDHFVPNRNSLLFPNKPVTLVK